VANGINYNMVSVTNVIVADPLSVATPAFADLLVLMPSRRVEIEIY